MEGPGQAQFAVKVAVRDRVAAQQDVVRVVLDEQDGQRSPRRAA